MAKPPNKAMAKNSVFNRRIMVFSIGVGEFKT